MISDATVKMVKYSPEKIPDSWFGNVPLSAEFAPPVLDLKNIAPYLVTLSSIQVPNGFNVLLRARYDGIRVEENVQGMLNIMVGAWGLPAKTALYLNFFGVAAALSFHTHYGLWVIKPTIAHKLLFGIPLVNDEKALAEKLDIYSTVEKGLLPLPLRLQVEREYQVLGEETHSRLIVINAANTVFTIEALYPKPGEILVLTRMAATPWANTDIVRFIVDRDEDIGYANVTTFPLSLAPGGEVECFIPAIRELRLTTSAATAPGNTWFRYTFQRVKLTNILRARFGLAAREELPGDTYDKVMAGVL